MTLRINQPQSPKISSVENILPVDRNQIEFNQILDHTNKLQQDKVETFLVKLDEQSDKLSKNLSLKDLIEFKNMIKSFLQTTFGQSRTMREETVWDFNGRSKVMSRITNIDKNLEELGRKIIDKNMQPIEILAKIDEIKGLIIDLLA